MATLTGLALLACFLVVVVAIVRGQSPVIMLLILAIAWSAIAGISIENIQSKILQGGGVAYASAVIIIVFGAWFAQVLIQTGIAESVIRSAVELAGDRPLVTAMTITLVTAILFSSMYGVGAAIAIGVIALPIMMSQGIPPAVAAPAFTMGIGAGTFVNIVQFGTFEKLFPGIKYEAPYLNFWLLGSVIYVLMAWLMTYLHLRRLGVRKASSVDVAEGMAPRRRTPYYTYIVPIFPVIMIVIFQWQIIPTFLLSIVLALVLTWKDADAAAARQPVQQDVLRRLPRYRDHRGAVDDLRHDHRRRADARGRGRPEADLRPHPARDQAAGGVLLRHPGRRLQHLSRTDGGDRHGCGDARLDPEREQPLARVPLLDLAGADDSAGQHGPDQFVDAVDHRLHQGEPWRIPENGPALRHCDGGHHVVPGLRASAVIDLYIALMPPLRPRIVGGEGWGRWVMPNHTHQV